LPATVCDAHTQTDHPRIDRPQHQLPKVIRQRGTGPRATSSRNARATSSESALRPTERSIARTTHLPRYKRRGDWSVATDRRDRSRWWCGSQPTV
jgi:hypothetical protein